MNNKTIGIWVVIAFLLSTIWLLFSSNPPTCEEELQSQTKEVNEKNLIIINECGENSWSTIDELVKCMRSREIPKPKNTCGSWIHEEEIGSGLVSLHKKICWKQINSPLCKDYSLLERLYKITEERIPWKNWFPILVGMTNAESSLWLDYAKDKVGGTCTWRNNWGWAKYKINDDNTREYSRNLNWFNYVYDRSRKLHNDQYGCNLFPFSSIEEYWISKVNWIRFWYKGCVDADTPVTCVSYKYVGNPNVSEKSWVNNVSYFLN